MNFKTLSVIASLTVLVGGLQAAEARNTGKPSPGQGGAPSGRNFGLLAVSCTQSGDTAGASFANVSGIGQTVQLQVNNTGVAQTAIENLNNSTVTMLGAMQFYCDGPASNLGVRVTQTVNGGGVLASTFTLANGGLQKASAQNLYFIGVNNANGNVQIPGGSRINDVTFKLVGTTGQITNRIYGFSFTGFGGVGYDLTTPGAFCAAQGAP